MQANPESGKKECLFPCMGGVVVAEEKPKQPGHLRHGASTPRTVRLWLIQNMLKDVPVDTLFGILSKSQETDFAVRENMLIVLPLSGQTPHAHALPTW